jgi:hypothetical protein
VSRAGSSRRGACARSEHGKSKDPILSRLARGDTAFTDLLTKSSLAYDACELVGAFGSLDDMPALTRLVERTETSVLLDVAKRAVERLRARHLKTAGGLTVAATRGELTTPEG